MDAGLYEMLFIVFYLSASIDTDVVQQVSEKGVGVDAVRVLALIGVAHEREMRGVGCGFECCNEFWSEVDLGRGLVQGERYGMFLAALGGMQSDLGHSRALQVRRAGNIQSGVGLLSSVIRDRIMVGW